MQKSRREDDDKQPALARYFERRQAQGFNVLQTRLVGGDNSTSAYDHAAFVSNNFAAPPSSTNLWDEICIKENLALAGKKVALPPA